METFRDCSSGNGPSEATQPAKAVVIDDENKGERQRDPEKAAAPNATTGVMAGLDPAIYVVLSLAHFFAHFAARTSTVPVPVRP